MRRDLGQNFLRDPNILGVIERVAALAREDVVLEIGGGEGALSAYLAPRVGALHVIEIDPRLRPALAASVGGLPGVQLHWGDAMRLDLTALAPAPTKVVANLPYSIAAGALLRTIELLPDVALWVAMVQREVGLRLAAPPGDGIYGVSSVLAQLAGEVSVVRAIPRTVFQPVPNVDSVLVRIQRTGSAAPPPLRQLVRGAFAHRRKALAGSLALAGLPFERAAVRAALVQLGHPPDARAERLSPRDFRELERILRV
jgi:16S rRNA (adenine1518-N6/adenine1519-N6)-dimethyltransferase